MDHSSLGRLPAELRVQIFSIALLAPRPVTIVSAPTSNRLTAGFKAPGEDFVCALLDTCQAVRKEATPIFLTCNTFHVDLRTDKYQSRVPAAVAGCAPAPSDEVLLGPLWKFATTLDEYQIENAQIEIIVNIFDLFTSRESQNDPVVLSALLQAISRLQRRHFSNGSCTIKSGLTLGSSPQISDSGEEPFFIDFRFDFSEWEQSLREAGRTVYVDRIENFENAEEDEVQGEPKNGRKKVLLLPCGLRYVEWAWLYRKWRRSWRR